MDNCLNFLVVCKTSAVIHRHTSNYMRLRFILIAWNSSLQVPNLFPGLEHARFSVVGRAPGCTRRGVHVWICLRVPLNYFHFQSLIVSTVNLHRNTKYIKLSHVDPTFLTEVQLKKERSEFYSKMNGETPSNLHYRDRPQMNQMDRMIEQHRRLGTCSLASMVLDEGPKCREF